MNYGKAIKELRLKLNQNQEGFALNIGIKQGTLSNIETGTRKPSVEVLDKISEYVKMPLPIILWSSVTVDDIYDDKKEMFELLKPSIDELIESGF